MLIRQGERLDYLIVFWIAVTYLPRFYVSLAIQRIVYSYYFINILPALGLGIPYRLACLSLSAKKIY